MLDDIGIAKVRTSLLFLAGLSCLLYAVLAVAQDTPRPFWWFIPMMMGVMASIGISIAFMLSDPASRRMAHDEMYDQINHKAQRHSYWVAIGLYPAFALYIKFVGLEWTTAFAAMGTLTGASYLLLLTFYEWRAS